MTPLNLKSRFTSIGWAIMKATAYIDASSVRTYAHICVPRLQMIVNARYTKKIGRHIAYSGCMCVLASLRNPGNCKTFPTANCWS